jgi:hypothetical protein
VSERTVEIQEGERGILSLLGSDGHTEFWQPLSRSRTNYLKVSSLQVSEILVRRNYSSTPEQLTLRQVVKGSATICDRSLSVIGDTRNVTQNIAISISADPPEERIARNREWMRPENWRQQRGVTAEDLLHSNACLGFTPAFVGEEADTFGHTDDKWYLEISVPQLALDSLVDAIFNQRAHSLHIGVSFISGIYFNDGPGAIDFDEPLNLFLRPEIKSGRVRVPEPAYGQFVFWSLRFSPLAELLDPFGPDRLPEPRAAETTVVPGSSDIDKVLAALGTLNLTVESLRAGGLRATWTLAALLVLFILLKQLW